MTSHNKGLVLTLVATGLMSLDSIFIRLSGLSDFAPSFLFGLFSLISMTFVTKRKTGDLTGTIKASGPILLVSGILMGISGTTFTLAVQKTTIANALLIMSLSPFFSAIFSRLFLKEQVRRETGIAILISFFGMYIIVSSALDTGGITGDLLALVCGLAVSLNFVLYRKYPRIDRSLVIAAGGFFIALFSAGLIAPSDFTLYGVVVMMIMGLFTAPLGRMLQATSARYITAVEIGLLAQIKVFLASLIIWVLYNEVPSIPTFIGGALILMAAIGHSLIAMRRERKRHQATIGKQQALAT